MSFVHLHTHTQYSLLDGSNKITEYVKRVKELGMNAAAITDHGSMYGVIEFYEECLKNDINPILGCEVYVAPGSRFDKEATHGEDKYYHLVLLAENNEGYQNLMKIVSIGYTEGFYYRPRVDKETLKKYSKGIIASSACLAGEISRRLEEGNYDAAKQAATEYDEIFGHGNFFLELQDHGIPIQKTVNTDLMRLSAELGIELICTNDIHYTAVADADSHDILLCIQTGKTVNDEDRMRYEGGQFYVKSEEEMASLFAYAPQALENTQKIADRCHVEIEFGVTKLPKFDVPDGMDSWEYLQKLCYAGLERRFGKIWEQLENANSAVAEDSKASAGAACLDTTSIAAYNPDKYGREILTNRLKYELETIHKMGFVDYFLIVSDFIKYARDNGIPVGPGRGSAAGSVVAYTLGITNIDPIRYDLLFERFLNPERVSMPDIDVDFCYERRSEVIDYVTRKYGEDCVVQIVTFGTLQAKGVIRDVVRVLDLPYSTGDNLAKMIPGELGMTLDKALEKNPELKNLYETDAETKHIIDICKSLEGLPRHTSKHAAGVLICGKPVDEYVPLSKSPDGAIVAQFDMITLERLGLLKMDFLGLRTLTVLNDAVKHVKDMTGETVDLDNLNWNDKSTYELLGSGKTDGVFQLESAGMKNFMKQLKPDSMEDVIAGISLYRPGPMDFIPKYIKGKEDRENVEYDCDELKPILEGTYGCIVYQEQVMRIVRDLAGFSMGRSDNLRRAMSKKKAKVMQAERQAFLYGDDKEGVPGCVKNSIDETTANKIYDEMISFAAYAFNKSHAAAYAVVAYQTAYLKNYYPVEFMCALMTSVIDNSTKLAGYINTCKNMGIKILPPDINTGRSEFVPVKINENGKEILAIRYALSAIKGVGQTVTDALVRERSEHGTYNSIEEFVTRAADILSRSGIESFIKAGALDSLGLKRKAMLYMAPTLISDIQKSKKQNFAGQISLFDIATDDEKEELKVAVPNVEEYTRAEILEMEKEILGVYVSGHPLDDYIDVIKKNVTAYASDFYYDESDGCTRVKDKTQVIVGGMLTDVKPYYTKKNQPMAFVTIEDLTGSIEGMVFPRDYMANRSELSNDNKVFVIGNVSEEDEKDSKLIINKILPLNSKKRTVWIRFKNKEEYNESAYTFGELDGVAAGFDQVVVYLETEKQRKIVSPRAGIKVTDELLDSFISKFGMTNVEVTEKSIEIRL